METKVTTARKMKTQSQGKEVIAMADTVNVKSNSVPTEASKKVLKPVTKTVYKRISNVHRFDENKIDMLFRIHEERYLIRYVDKEEKLAGCSDITVFLQLEGEDWKPVGSAFIAKNRKSVVFRIAGYDCKFMIREATPQEITDENYSKYVALSMEELTVTPEAL